MIIKLLVKTPTVGFTSVLGTLKACEFWASGFERSVAKDLHFLTRSTKGIVSFIAQKVLVRAVQADHSPGKVAKVAWEEAAFVAEGVISWFDSNGKHSNSLKRIYWFKFEYSNRFHL